MVFSQHGASVHETQQIRPFVNFGMQAAPGSNQQVQQVQQSNLPNGNTDAQSTTNFVAHAQNDSSSIPLELPRNSGDSLSQLPTSAKEILKRASASTNFNSESPEWAAAREQVLKSMSSNNHQPLLFSRPRGRGRGRPRGSTIQNGDRAITASRDLPTEGGAVVVPIRRGRGGRPRGSRGSRGRGRGRGGKRKRDDDTEGGDPTDSDDQSDDSNSLPTTPTVTKSGRSITRPSQYNPAPQPSPPSGTKRKRPYNRKEIEQILCVKCSRGHSPPSNQIVLCDGCDFAYHQWCHDPMIGKEAAETIGVSWFCGNCLHAREVEALPLAQRVSGVKLSIEEKWAYLSTLSSPTLLSLLMHATSLHPDLPIFAPNTSLFTKASNKALAILPTQPDSRSGSNVGISQNLHSANTNRNHINSQVPSSTPYGIPSDSTQSTNSEDDPYPDYSNEDGDPPVTYPRPGRGPIKLCSTTIREDLPWMMEDNHEVFSHLISDGSGTNALVRLGNRKAAWLNGDPASTARAPHSQPQRSLQPAPDAQSTYGSKSSLPDTNLQANQVPRNNSHSLPEQSRQQTRETAQTPHPQPDLQPSSKSEPESRHPPAAVQQPRTPPHQQHSLTWQTAHELLLFVNRQPEATPMQQLAYQTKLYRELAPLLTNESLLHTGKAKGRPLQPREADPQRVVSSTGNGWQEHERRRVSLQSQPQPQPARALAPAPIPTSTSTPTPAPTSTPTSASASSSVAPFHQNGGSIPHSELHGRIAPPSTFASASAPAPTPAPPHQGPRSSHWSPYGGRQLGGGVSGVLR